MGGWEAPSDHQSSCHAPIVHAAPIIPAPLSVTRAPPPSFLRPSPSPPAPHRHSCAPSVIPAQAGTPRAHASPLPPSRGEVRWGVGGNERPPVFVSRSNRPRHPHHSRAPLRHPRPPPSPPPPTVIAARNRHSCAQPSFLPPPPHRHSCAGRNPRAHAPPLSPFPNSYLPPSRGEVRWGVGGPERPPAIVHAPPPPYAPQHPDGPPALRGSAAGRPFLPTQE